MSNAHELAGRVAVVVGGSRGIGRAVAERFVAEGAAVVVNGRAIDAVDETVTDIVAAGGTARGVAGSAADPLVADELVRVARRDLDGLDIVVNCAGAPEPPGSSILSVTSDDWQALIDAHLTSTFEICRAAVPQLVSQGSGSVITTGSHAYTGTFGGTGYAAGKGGVISLTYALAAELREHGVRVNAVCPGARTRLSSGAVYEAQIESLHDRGLLDDAMYAGAHDPGPPAHAASVYAFLASDRAATLTGQVLVAAGGFVGRFAPPEVEFVEWRDHHDVAPYSVAELAALLTS